MQNMGISIVALSQGVPFYHAGVEMLRSKSLDRNSYNSGDWFNVLDFTYETNGWGHGLPPAGDNQDMWDVMRPLLGNPDIVPTKDNILAAGAHFREMLQIRKSSKLFRLETAEDIKARLTFLNTGPDQIPGLIVMSLSDGGDLESLDPMYERIVVLFNASNEEITFSADEWANADLTLHPVQAASADPIVQTATFEAGTFTVPAMTTVVFVLAE
jgi:pullulanase/glycogen debranching enzyme